jgi:hypothetical protein
VSTRLSACALVVAMILLFAASSRAAENAPLLKDLTAVIALHGQTCGPVVSAVRTSEVVVEKQEATR